MTKVSVCMCTKDREQELRFSVQSILDQTMHDWELLVCDNSSMDGTIKLLAGIRESNKAVKFMVADPGTTYVDAHNAILKHASGKYICWMDSDDLCNENRLEAQAKFLDEHPDVDVVSCTTVLTNGYVLGNTLEEHTHQDILKLLADNPMSTICHFQSCMFRAECLYSFPGQTYFFPEFNDGRCGEAFLYTLLALGYKFHNISSTVYLYRIGVSENSMSRTCGAETVAEVSKLPLKDMQKKMLGLLEEHCGAVIPHERVVFA